MREERIQSFLKIAGSLLLMGFCLGPFLYMLHISFHESVQLSIESLKEGLTVRHYREVLLSPDVHFGSYLRNSLVVSLMSALLAVLIASWAAYALTRTRLRAKNIILFAVLAVSMFPQVSLVGYLFKMMTALGWINHFAALVFPYTAWILPLALWILVSYFAALPRDLDDAARIDGCSRWQVLYRVLMPVALPGLVSTFVLVFIAAFNEFMFALILTTDYHARTLPVGMALFEGTYGQIPWGSIMAASVLAVLPVIALTLVFQRKVVQGLTGGSVKE